MELVLPYRRALPLHLKLVNSFKYRKRHFWHQWWRTKLSCDYYVKLVWKFHVKGKKILYGVAVWVRSYRTELEWWCVYWLRHESAPRSFMPYLTAILISTQSLLLQYWLIIANSWAWLGWVELLAEFLVLLNQQQTLSSSLCSRPKHKPNVWSLEMSKCPDAEMWKSNCS